MAKRPGDVESLDKFDPAAASLQAGTEGAPATLEAETSYGSDVRAADAADGRDETEDIKARIEETRANMGETIDAIQERLSLSNISEQVSEQVTNVIETAKDTVYDATIGKAVKFMNSIGTDISSSKVVTTMRSNPLPFILIGVGAGMLAYGGLGSQKRGRAASYRYRSSEAYRGLEGESTGSHGTLGSAAESVTDTAGSAYNAVTDAAGRAYSGIGDAAHRVYEKAGEFGHRAHETYDHYLDEKPWAIGAIALVAGAAVGLALPTTRYEGELMGEARLNLMNKAQEAAADLMGKARDAASEAGRTLKDEAQAIADEI
jgi:ElaB/YqjD/DUF883 family membrane-anchored ribosome-binding protein